MTMTPSHEGMNNLQSLKEAAQERFLGLAPFLRLSIAGIDFLPLARDMLATAGKDENNANLWMNLATIMMCLRQRDVGLTLQAQALASQHCFHLAAAAQPARLSLLVLCVAGDLSANAPLDCLLEDSDIDLDFYFVSATNLMKRPVPEHDAVFVAISADDESIPVLNALGEVLASWSKPVLNVPQNVPTTERQAASLLLQDIPGLAIAPALRMERTQLEAVATGHTSLVAIAGCNFPVILRPVGSHGGRGLDKMESSETIARYLEDSPGDAFFLSRFIDYSGPDGLFRKFRVVLIEGRPYGCHMAVSTHWMIHYVNAAMYENAQRRAEEAAFLDGFDAFAQRHATALTAIAERTRLDYLGIDCAETHDGQLLVFEIDHAMVIHAMDSEMLFPHKQRHMRKVREAFREMLLHRITKGSTPVTD